MMILLAASGRNKMSETILPLPCHYESEYSYVDQWKAGQRSDADVERRAEDEDVTIFSLTFQRDVDDDDGARWLMGCTSRGEVCVWNVPKIGDQSSRMDEGDEEYQAERKVPPYHPAVSAYQRTPLIRFRVSTGVLYACNMVQSEQNATWLLVSGDGGVQIFDWTKDILPAAKVAAATKNCGFHAPRPVYQFKPFPSALEADIEINDFTVQGHHLYGAAGDAFGCYKWDLNTQKLVTTYRQPKGGYLHTVSAVPQQSLLLMGGEDGILSIWDYQKDKLVDSIDVVPKPRASSQNIPSTFGQYVRRQPSQSPSAWISSTAVSKDWWIVAGGMSNQRGFYSTYHAPTRTLINCTGETRETPQQVAWLHDSMVVSVGNESFVSCWKNPLSWADRQRCYGRAPSSYAVAVSNNCVATAGVGGAVDLFDCSDGTLSSDRLPLTL
jgi:WD40 repeat protein